MVQEIKSLELLILNIKARIALLAIKKNLHGFV